MELKFGMIKLAAWTVGLAFIALLVLRAGLSGEQALSALGGLGTLMGFSLLIENKKGQ